MPFVLDQQTYGHIPELGLGVIVLGQELIGADKRPIRFGNVAHSELRLAERQVGFAIRRVLLDCRSKIQDRLVQLAFGGKSDTLINIRFRAARAGYIP